MIIGYSKYDFPKRKTKDFILWGLLYLVLVSIIGLRYKVGGDTYNYMAYFDYAPELSFGHLSTLVDLNLVLHCFLLLLRLILMIFMYIKVLFLQ